MKFRTEYEPIRSSLTLDIERPVAALGSCFAQNLTARMRTSLWKADNPLGVHFNPASMALAIETVLFSKDPVAKFEESLFRSDNIWHSWLFDSSFSSLNRQDAINKFSEAAERFKNILSEGHLLTATFGTAYCYHLRSSSQVVANCHKQRAELFERKRMRIDQIVEIWQGLLAKLADIDVIFTVSPVRHVRDGLHENNLSKATLMMAIERLCEKGGRSFYFPAYEILNDDLRDYRFYADDLVHPSPPAVEYIWEKFLETYTDAETCKELKRGESIMKRLQHRQIISDAERHKQFKAESIQLYLDFRRRHPNCLSIEVV